MNENKTAHLLAVFALASAALLTVLLFGTLPQAAAQPLPAPRITVDQIVAPGFVQPLYVTHAGDGSQRLFVVEQGGQIHVVQNGVVQPAPFLDVSNLIITGSERGLLGLAFHPNYESNGLFYVNYTRAGDGATVVARYQASAADPNAADPASATTVLTVTQPFANHNGGHLAFGPHDGYLYIGLGDGGGGGDPEGNAQNPNTLLGSLLRLDVDGGLPYGVPADNPYVGTAGRDEIWAIGLRNPWRFGFDRANGDLYIGDVGQATREEIDYQAAGTPGGLNFGWPCKEGTLDFTFTMECAAAQLTEPIAEYGRDLGTTVTGGYVYRGPAYPALQGRYFYADFGSGRIWSLIKTASNPDAWSAPKLELDTALNISSFGEDEAGELYVVDYSGGTVRRLAAFAYRSYLPLVARSLQ